ncbi:MAG: lysophospholipid acyltransferase family protein [Actinobacteria bacterium]|nr:lysophospholipid acyltransferase family protein [Actinomycetota bacterium]
MVRAPRVRRRQRLGFAYRLVVFILWPILRVIVKWEVSGTERLWEAEGGIVVAPNHTSWFDPPVVAFALWQSDRPPHFLGKESVFRVPIFGWLITHAGQIPVYRETAEALTAIRDALSALDRGECVVVYPEGTITRDPDVWPMSAKTGAVRIALTSGRPLFPLVQWGSHLVMGPYKKEFRVLPRKTVHIVVGDSIELSDLAGRPLDAETLAIASDRLMDAITAMEAQVRGQTPPVTRHVHLKEPRPLAPGDSDPGAA